MVTVTTTQELRAGDFLLRFEAKAFQDDIHGISSISARRCSGIVATHGRFFSLACRAFLLFFRWFTCFVFLVMFDILCKINSTCLLVAGFPRWKRVQYSKSLTHHKYQHRHLNHTMESNHDTTKMHSRPHHQCSRRSPGKSSHALSMTAVEMKFLHKTMTPRDHTARLTIEMCRK